MAYSGDEERAKKAQDLANDCSAITDTDRCEAASKIFDCGKNFVFNVDISHFHVVKYLIFFIFQNKDTTLSTPVVSALKIFKSSKFMIHFNFVNLI